MKIISNTGPIIGLAKINQLNLLNDLSSGGVYYFGLG